MEKCMKVKPTKSHRNEIWIFRYRELWDFVYFLNL